MVDAATLSLNSIRTHRRQVFGELLELPDSWLERTVLINGEAVPARWEAFSFADHEEEHLIQLMHTLQHNQEWKQSKAQQLLGAAEDTRGDLLAALTGLGDNDLDCVPESPEGEWSLRQILSHIIFVEHAYRIDILHAVESFEAGVPFGDLPDVDLPENYPDDTFDELLDRLDAARDQNIRELQHLPDEHLAAPAMWPPAEVDTGFLFMRLAHHEREHTAHIRKWRVQTGKHQREIERILGLAWVTHGRIRGELVGVPDTAMEHAPLSGEWTPAEILGHLEYADDAFKQRIETATASHEAHT